jgi:hypothetical protein
MTEIVIVTTPSFDGQGKRRHGRFDVRLQGGDEVICEATQQPLLDASRVLLQRGADPTATICRVRADASTIVTMRAPIGVAAEYDVMGEKFVRRKKPATGPMPGSEIENPVSAGPPVPCNANPTLRAAYSGSLKTESSPLAEIVRATSPTSLTTPKANKKPA